MEKTWRWWGPEDAITLAHVRQAGATGIVTALHDIPVGTVWTADAIAERHALIGADPSLGLRWAVVESLPVHENIKIGVGDLTPLFEAYRISLRNLAATGVRTVCYNFMPVLDWCRTELSFGLTGGTLALRFNMHEFAALDCYMLGRQNAESDYPDAIIRRAKDWFAKSGKPDREVLLANVMSGLPGAFERYNIDGLKEILARYGDVDASRLRSNLALFLQEVVPVAEEVGIRMAIHPDDPPWPLLGLPRIVSSETDIEALLNAVDSRANGLTLCTGSLCAAAGNDLLAIARRFADRIHFAHLRNVKRLPDGSFYESGHLDGDADLVPVVRTLLEEQAVRKERGELDWRIPFRPDHGAVIAHDADRPHHPGYPYIGRLKGMGELSGIVAALAAQGGYPT